MSNGLTLSVIHLSKCLFQITKLLNLSKDFRLGISFNGLILSQDNSNFSLIRSLEFETSDPSKIWFEVAVNFSLICLGPAGGPFPSACNYQPPSPQIENTMNQNFHPCFNRCTQVKCLICLGSLIYEYIFPFLCNLIQGQKMSLTCWLNRSNTLHFIHFFLIWQLHLDFDNFILTNN